VRQLKDRIRASDGVILATPEYNNGIPGVFKNAIDWLSRPPGDIASVFGNRPFAIMGASPGRLGTVLSQNQWLPVLKTLGVRLWSGGQVMVSRATEAFDESGAFKDEKQRAKLESFLSDFARFIEAR
jgi:chromate reductase, NAD(P)H dehydrogenase (quinone)